MKKILKRLLCLTLIIPFMVFGFFPMTILYGINKTLYAFDKLMGGLE